MFEFFFTFKYIRWQAFYKRKTNTDSICNDSRAHMSQNIFYPCIYFPHSKNSIAARCILDVHLLCKDHLWLVFSWRILEDDNWQIYNMNHGCKHYQHLFFWHMCRKGWYQYGHKILPSFLLNNFIEINKIKFLQCSLKAGIKNKKI